MKRSLKIFEKSLLFALIIMQIIDAFLLEIKMYHNKEKHRSPLYEQIALDLGIIFRTGTRVKFHTSGSTNNFISVKQSKMHTFQWA